MRKIIVLIAVMAGLCSCTDYLKVEPSNVLAVANYDDVKALLGGYLRMYADPTSTTLQGTVVPYQENDFWTFLHLLTDDVDSDKYIQSSYGNNNKTLFVNTLDWKNSETPGIIWQTLYLNIGFFNTILDELGRVDASREQADIVRCEAMVLRAWHLFKLLQYFSPYHSDKLGIPANLDAQLVGDYDARRKSQKEVYGILIDELTEVLECETSPRETYNVFYDKKIVNALLAEIYLFKGGSGAGEITDYDHAIRHAQAAMEGRKLQSLSEYVHFPVFPEKEGVKKDYPQGLLYDNRSDRVLQNICGMLPYVKMAAAESLVKMYDEKDVRKENFFDESGNILKYANVNPIGSYLQFTVYTFFSYAEMHLIVAESYARKGDAQAKKWLEDFQRCRICDYDGYKGNDVLQEILNERRREFCFEYDMRWCDLIRTQEGWTRNSYGDEEEATYTLEDGDYRFCMPIPLNEELQYNDIEQNPGWGFLMD